MNDSQTPRGLIEKFISNSEANTTVHNESSTSLGTRNQKAKKRTISGSDASEKGRKPKVQNRSNLSVLSESTITPRTMIEGLIQGDGSIEQTIRRQKQRVPSSRRSASFDGTRSSPRSTSKKKSLRKTATMKNFLQNQTIGPTPRGMIQGFLAEAPESTPIVNAADSEPLHTTQIEDLLQKKKRNRSLGESYYLPSSAPEPSTYRDDNKTERQRKQRDPNEFARRAAERMDMLNDEATAEMSITGQVIPPTQKEADFTVGYEKTEDLKRIMSSRHVSMATPGDLSIPSLDDFSASDINNLSSAKAERRRSTRLSKSAANCIADNSSLSESGRDGQETVPGKPSPHRTNKLSMSAASVAGIAEQSTRHSPRISLGIGTDNEATTTVSKSGFTSKSNTKTVQLTDVTPLSPSERYVTMENLEHSKRLSNKDIQGINNMGNPSNDIVEDGNDHDNSGDKIDEEQTDEESKEDDSESDNEDDEQDESEESQPDNGDNDIEGETANNESTMGNSRNTGYDTMQTPQLPTPEATPARLREATKVATPAQAFQKTSTTVKKPNEKKTKKKPAGPSRLPRSLTKNIFAHFCKYKVSKQVLDEVETIADDYWKNVSSDLSAYVKHANRNTVDENDIELLMKRQGFVTEKQSMHTAIAKYLPLEYQTELIPVARAGNVVYPKK